MPLCEPINEPQGPAVKFRLLQWIWAVCGRGAPKSRGFALPSPPPPPPPPAPPLPLPPTPPPSHCPAQTLPLFTAQTLHPGSPAKEKAPDLASCLPPNIRPGRGGRRAAFKLHYTSNKEPSGIALLPAIPLDPRRQTLSCLGDQRRTSVVFLQFWVAVVSASC